MTRITRLTSAAATAALVIGLLLPAIGMAATSPPPPATNDERANATVVSEPLPWSDFVDTSAATSDGSDPDCFGNGASVWYLYAPSVSGLVQADTIGSDYDTTLSAYELQPDDSLVQVACNDDAFDLQSAVEFEGQAGATYLFMVGSLSGIGSILAFNVGEPAPPPPPIAVDLVLDGGSVDRSSGHVTVRATITCSSPSDGYTFFEVRQRVGRQYIFAWGDAPISCGPEPSQITVTTYSESGVFAGGPATVRMYAEAFDGISWGSTFTEGTIRMRG